MNDAITREINLINQDNEVFNKTLENERNRFIETINNGLGDEMKESVGGFYHTTIINKKSFFERIRNFIERIVSIIK